MEQRRCPLCGECEKDVFGSVRSCDKPGRNGVGPLSCVGTGCPQIIYKILTCHCPLREIIQREFVRGNWTMCSSLTEAEVPWGKEWVPGQSQQTGRNLSLEVLRNPNCKFIHVSHRIVAPQNGENCLSLFSLF